jgi:glycosyltransferase involved in cell wall biosynthesis
VSERTRIWYLIGTLAVGGAERSLVDLVNNLDRNRFEPVIYTIAEPGPLADDINSDIPVRSLGAANKVDLRVPLRLVRALRREQPAVLQSFLYFDNILARLVGTLSPETAVITGVRAVPDDRAIHRDAVDRLTMPLSDYIVSNSEAGREWVIDQGASPDRVRVVRNGRELDAYDVPEPPGLGGELGVGDGPVVGTVGRLLERKGHHDLLRAWPSVLERHPDAALVLVGDGPERKSLQQRAEELGITDSVHLLGTREDVPELLALFDCFVFPSHFEGLPGALLEAMAAELPIVTTPVDGCSELVRDGEHGVHVPPHDPERLGVAVAELLEERERAAALGAAARRRAHESFGVEAMVEGFERVYEMATHD